MNVTMRRQRVRTISTMVRNRNAARPPVRTKAGGKTRRTAKADVNRGVRCTRLGWINIMMILGSTTPEIEANTAAGPGHYYPVWGEGSEGGFCDDDPSRRPAGDDELHERCEDLARRRFHTAGECCNHMFGHRTFASGKEAECTARSTPTPPPQGRVPPARVNSTSKLPACNMTTAELMKVGKDPVDSCILYDTQPQTSDSEAERTTVVTVVGVFDSSCGVHRDGAMVAVEMLNRDKGGRGAPIGYNEDHFVKFRLIVAIAGNSKQQTPDNYKLSHTNALEDLILSASPQYILGSCSFYARYDKELAGKHGVMVLSQVGPQAFYRQDSNEHVFGVHIPSELYGVPAFRALEFAHEGPEERARRKIRIVHRDRSEFFRHTCRAIHDRAIERGFSSAVAVEYDPEADEDGDGLPNQEDEDFLRGLADRVCGREERLDGVAIWACVQHDFEIDVILDRLRENGCRPSSFWATKASTGWAKKRIEAVPYFQAGSQWHIAMDYSDEYFESGQAMLDHLEGVFGYPPSYSATGSYHAIYVMYKNIWSFFKAQDVPEVESTLRNSYEDLRRNMLDLSIPETLYGPTIFDSDQRNVGRGSAASQWLFPAGSSLDQAQMILVSPDAQASSAVAYPAASSMACDAGSYANETLASAGPALLESKCSECPADSYQPAPNVDASCRACRAGSGTARETGAVICVQENKNLIAPGVVIFGYLIVALNISLAAAFATWTVLFQNDPVVTIGQKEFLLLLCAGTTVSSSSIVPLSLQAGTSEDATAASRACAVVPWLYATGVTLLYSALFAKSFRMYQVVNSSRGMRRMQVTVRSTLTFVFAAVLVMWLILIPWTIVDPFHWERFELVDLIDESAGVITHESIGRCTSDYFGVWLGIIFLLHFMIVVATNAMLWRLRFVADRYQESKYVTLACLFAVEFLMLGIPILTAIGDSSSLRHITLIFIIALSDTIILLMIFIPKIMFQRQGLPESTTVVGSIMRRDTITRRASEITLPSDTMTRRRASEITLPLDTMTRRASKITLPSDTMTRRASEITLPMDTMTRRVSEITLPTIPQQTNGDSNHDNELQAGDVSDNENESGNDEKYSRFVEYTCNKDKPKKRVQ